ncbi:MAG: leucyl aminopeptidase family protein, partial [Deltaproteobacteria bacterium]|nr:leucyl aminopeptidase family protein [Deltaproteobacteria bacterium]
MTTLSFARNTKALLKGAKELLLIAPARLLDAKRLPRLFGRRLDALARDLASDLAPGQRGAVSTSLGAEGVRWMHVGALPNDVSRYNSPARAEAIRHTVSQAGLGLKGKLAIVLVLEDPAHYLAAAGAVSRALPKYSAKSKPSRQRVQLIAVDTKGAVIEVDPVISNTVEYARDSAALVDTPPSELHPGELSARVHAALADVEGVTIEEYVGDALVEHGLMGIHSVGRAAMAEPRMLVATYDPGDASRHVALVGKGVTFDTGGLHIKARGSMEGMKADMGGAAAVFGAFRSLVSSGCKHRVSLLMCMAENSVDSNSYKPDDVLTMHSGKTVEINNTDAEGRLLLMDGLSWAARELGADVIFDAATLTGAQLIATGVIHAAIVTNDADMESAMVNSGKVTGDLVHPLLFAPELL